MKRLYAVVVLGLLVFGTAMGQLASRIDQYYQDFSIINPASINASYNSRLSLFYNRLYTAIPGSPNNIFASVVLPNPDKRIGFGANFGQERIGFSTLYNGYITYAYTMPFTSRSRLHTAASLGLLTQRFNPNAIDVINQDDPLYLSLQQGRPETRFDLKLSACFQSGGFQFGISSGRITRPRFAFDYYTYRSNYYLDNLSSVYTSFRMKVSNDIILQPVAVANVFDWRELMLQWGVNMHLRDVMWVGLHSAGNKNLSVHVGGQVKNTIRIGYSYSMPFSASSKLLGSGHEFYTAILLGKTENLIKGMSEDAILLTKLHNDTTAADYNTDIEKPVRKQKKGQEENQEKETYKVESIKMSNDTIFINSFEEMKVLRFGYDTAKIALHDIPLAQPQEGYYVTVGVFKNEANANKQVKIMYAKGITSFKFYLPENKYYYVYIFRGETPEEADEVKWQEQLEIPDIWTKRIHR
ncbi:MAG: PorP/SprF family type IX secretion system membrane protein [Bacteroidetes bacterium]|nr:PorP/SprF family type IX secretion system membrane protein [Bacteroidota bacterium]